MERVSLAKQWHPYQIILDNFILPMFGQFEDDPFLVLDWTFAVVCGTAGPFKLGLWTVLMSVSLEEPTCLDEYLLTLIHSTCS